MLAINRLSSVIKKEFCSAAQLADALESITFAELKLHVDTILYKETNVQGLVGGNILESTALESWRLLQARLSGSAVASLEQVAKARVRSLAHLTRPMLEHVVYKVAGNALALVVDATDLNGIEIAGQSSEITDRVLYEVLSRYV